MLKREAWKSVYKDPNHQSKSFPSTFFNIFQVSFPVKYKSSTEKS